MCEQRHGFIHGQAHHAGEAAAQIGHKHAAQALYAVGAGFVHRLAAGDIGADFGLAQGFKGYVALLGVMISVPLPMHAHGGKHLVHAAGEVLQHFAGVFGGFGFAQNVVVQRHGGVGAEDGVFGRMAVLRLPLQQRGGVFLGGHARHIGGGRFEVMRRFVDVGLQADDGVAEIFENFAAARAAGGEIEGVHKSGRLKEKGFIETQAFGNHDGRKGWQS